MENRIISKRYAKALIYDIDFSLYDELLKDIYLLKNVINKHLLEILSAPIVSKNHKEKIIKEFTDNLNFSKKWKAFFDLLEKKRRIGFLIQILEELEILIYKMQNKEKIVIFLAHKESEKTIQNIEKKIAELLSKQIVSEVKTDSSILGGFLVKTRNLHIDGSIHGNLIRLKKIIEQE